MTKPTTDEWKDKLGEYHEHIDELYSIYHEALNDPNCDKCKWDEIIGVLMKVIDQATSRAREEERLKNTKELFNTVCLLCLENGGKIEVSESTLAQFLPSEYELRTYYDNKTGGKVFITQSLKKDK